MHAASGIVMQPRMSSQPAPEVFLIISAECKPPFLRECVGWLLIARERETNIPSYLVRHDDSDFFWPGKVWPVPLICSYESPHRFLMTPPIIMLPSSIALTSTDQQSDVLRCPLGVPPNVWLYSRSESDANRFNRGRQRFCLTERSLRTCVLVVR